MVTKNKIYVVKLGTSSLTSGGTALNAVYMMTVVEQCVALRAQGHKVILVSSGAITAGRAHLNHPDLPNTTASKQLLAAVGQIRLIQLWASLFAQHQIHIGQMLISRADMEDKERFLNAQDMLEALLNQGIVPIVNENDAVSTAEIKVGDNDTLSALVGLLAKADSLVLLTDQSGLFDSNPRNNPNAKLIKQVLEITPDLYALAGGSGSALGTGGMHTKLQAADIAMRAGLDVIIAAGNAPNILLEIAVGAYQGTTFVAHKNQLERRKQWIFGPALSGTLVVDNGAKVALQTKGSSLLPRGIVAVEGAFLRGAVIVIQDPHQQIIARGVARYASADLRKIAGKKSTDIEPILGYFDGDVAVHRDEMIITL